MFKIQEKIDPRVNTFLEKVQSITKGYDVYVGGGYLRDLDYHFCEYSNLGYEHVNPKDIDLFFVPNGESEKVLPTIAQSYTNYDKPATLISPDMVARGVSHLRGLWLPKEDLPTNDVQFIVYGKYMTMKELAADMSENINQTMYHVEKGRYCTEAYVDGHTRQVIKQLHTYDEERMALRLLRMKDKFPDYEVDTDIDLSHYMYLENDLERGGSFCEE